MYSANVCFYWWMRILASQYIIYIYIYIYTPADIYIKKKTENGHIWHVFICIFAHFYIFTLKI